MELLSLIISIVAILASLFASAWALHANKKFNVVNIRNERTKALISLSSFGEAGQLNLQIALESNREKKFYLLKAYTENFIEKFNEYSVYLESNVKNEIANLLEENYKMFESENFYTSDFYNNDFKPYYENDKKIKSLLYNQIESEYKGVKKYYASFF